MTYIISSGEEDSIDDVTEESDSEYDEYDSEINEYAKYYSDEEE